MQKTLITALSAAALLAGCVTTPQGVQQHGDHTSGNLPGKLADVAECLRRTAEQTGQHESELITGPNGITLHVTRDKVFTYSTWQLSADTSGGTKYDVWTSPYISPGADRHIKQIKGWC